jgi:predicted AlkP superfamily phosphohydrolase/phosphomutase
MRLAPNIFRLAAAAIAILAFTQCSQDQSDDSVGSQPTVELAFAGWDEFRTSDYAQPRQPHQVVFIGIDGAAWWYVDQMIAEGKLPNIARVKREGVHGVLRSVSSQVSPPAWTAMMSGFLPGKSGIYTFGRWVRRTEQFLTARSYDVKVPFVWDAASHTGRKVAVVNVPMSYPVSSVNGIMASGLFTPVDRVTSIGTASSPPRPLEDYIVDTDLESFAPVAIAAEQDSLNIFLYMLHDTQDDGVDRHDTVTLRVLDRRESDPGRRELGQCRFRLGEYSPWVRIMYNRDGRLGPAFTRVKCVQENGEVTTRFSSTVFPIEAQFTYPVELADELIQHFGVYFPSKYLGTEIIPKRAEETADYGRFFYDYDDWDLFTFVFTETDHIHHQVGFTEAAAGVYGTIDAFIGDVMDRLPEGGTLIIGSDHGFGEYDYGIDMNRFLADLKLLEWEGTRGVAIDHARTLVFHNLYFLYFNYDLITREELARRGIEVPDGRDPVDYLAQYIEEAGRRMRSPERAFPLEFERLPRGLIGDPPEMMVKGTYTDYGVQFWNIMKPRDRVVYELHGSARFWHQRDGIFLVWGAGARKGYDAGIRSIADIAPTMSYLLGVPLSPEMDGKALTDLFTGDLASRPRYRVTDYNAIPKEVARDTEERENLLKKLRSLGYVQ